MPLDAILLTALRRELENSLLGAKIDRISMPEKDVLILSVHSREQGSRRVLISVRPGSARISLTEQTMENPPQPPMFCMLLRKYLIGARITALEQPLGERLLILRLDTVDELNCRGEKTLVLELMGKGLNLLLLDGDGHILDCIRRVDYEDPNRRALLPGLFYTLPPQQEKPSFFRTEREECERLLTHADRTQPPDKWLLDTFGGLSPLLCRELSLGGWEGLGAALDALRARIDTGDFTPVMISIDGMPKDYTFQPVYQYGSRAELTEFSSFSELLDTFYRKKDQQENLRRRSADLTRTAKTARDRLLRKIAAREQELLETEKRVEKRRAVLTGDPVVPPEQPVRLPPDPGVEKHALAHGGQPGNANLRARERPEAALRHGDLLPDAERGMVYCGDLLKAVGERVGPDAATAVRLLRRENDLFAVNAFRQSLCAHDETSSIYNTDIVVSCVLY